MTDPARAFPVLASLDLGASRAFYTERLGFVPVHVGGDYLIVRRGAMEIHFWLADDPRFPENTSCYVRGGEVASLYDEWRAAGVERLSDFATRPWGMKEFYIHDPHGNLLRFGLRPEEA